MSHWFSNRGKLLIVQGQWEDAGASAIRMGLLHGASTPVAIDTEAEIQDLATVSALLALTGVDEPTGTWYTGAANAGRLALVRGAAVQDDTDNRAEMDAGNLTWTAAGTPDTNIYGGFVSDATTDTNDTTRQFVSLPLWTPVALNGSDLTATIAPELYRAA